MFGGGGEGEIASAATPKIAANRAGFNLTFGHAQPELRRVKTIFICKY
jgi:hypothetical protein